jgi:hypothetical protein
VVLRDKFPKARLHFLVLPRPPIDGFAPLRRESLPLLNSLLRQGQRLAQS